MPAWPASQLLSMDIPRAGNQSYTSAPRGCQRMRRNRRRAGLATGYFSAAKRFTEASQASSSAD